ncbi:MAG: hypothetical protein IMX01_08930 [Limnochordaceae bacterium]|nr:hypothetical protein [Limnochordaceae bacterium]
MGKIRAFGLVLIAAGIFFLGYRQGWWGMIAWWRVWAWLRAYWPVLLIIGGLLILLRPYRRAPWVDTLYSVLHLALDIGVVLVITSLMVDFGNWWTWDQEYRLPVPAPGGRVGQVVPREGPSRDGIHSKIVDIQWPEVSTNAGSEPARERYTVEAHLNLVSGGVDLHLGGAQAGSPTLLNGTLEYRHEAPTVRAASQGEPGRRHVTLDLIQSEEDRRWGGRWVAPFIDTPGPLRWQVGLAPEASWRVNTKVGASRADFDLRTVRLAGLAMDTGAGDFNLWLPGPGVWNQQLPSQPIDITLAAGAASVTIYVPRGVGVEFEVRSPVSSHNLTDPDLGLEKLGGGEYRSPAYEQAILRYHIHVAMGVSGLTFHWLGDHERV